MLVIVGPKLLPMNWFVVNVKIERTIKLVGLLKNKSTLSREMVFNLDESFLAGSRADILCT